MIKFEWGEHGARVLARTCRALVIVDVLSFSTAVDVAVSRGALVLPSPLRNMSALAEYAAAQRAELAVGRRLVNSAQPYSLSPATLANLPRGARLVLPSPNGATLSLIAAEHGCALYAACLRNATAVAGAIGDEHVGVIAAGERWPDGSLRPALEDLLGAGALIAALGARGHGCSPEAEAAALTFRGALDLARMIEGCVSGRELIEMGFPQDVEVASQVDASRAVPVYRDNAYVAAAPIA